MSPIDSTYMYESFGGSLKQAGQATSYLGACTSAGTFIYITDFGRIDGTFSAMNGA